MQINCHTVLTPSETGGVLSYDCDDLQPSHILYTHRQTVSYIKSWYALEIWLTSCFVRAIHGLLYLQGWAVQHQTESSHHTSYTLRQLIKPITTSKTYNLQKQSFAAHLPNRQQAKNQQNHTQGAKSNLIWLLSLRSRLGCSDFPSRVPHHLGGKRTTRTYATNY